MSYTSDFTLIKYNIQKLTRSFTPVNQSITSFITEYQNPKRTFTGLNNLPGNPNPLDVLAKLKKEGWLDVW